MRMLTLASILLLAGAGAVLAQTDGIPDLSPSYAYLAYTGPDSPTVLVIPDGTGARLDQAALADGTVVDATITLVLLDTQEFPIANFPWEDIWLQAADGGMVFCPGGTTPDANTDILGETRWTLPLRAGGWSLALTQVLVNGEALTSAPGLALNVNSPDLNGDLAVDLGDIAIFAGDYFGAYAFRADLHRDGVLNLSDVGALAVGFGSRCP